MVKSFVSEMASYQSLSFHAVLAFTCLMGCFAADNMINQHSHLCFSVSGTSLMRSMDRNQKYPICAVQRSLKLRMTDDGQPEKINFFKIQAKKIVGIVAAGISAFATPRAVIAASHYESNEPVILLPSQEQYARRVAITNDKDYENPVMKIVKDKRVWAGAGACAVGAGGYFLYQNVEKKKAEQVSKPL